MNIILDVLVGLVIASCVISSLFLLTKVYFCYFAKPKQEQAVEEKYCAEPEVKKAAPRAKKTATKKIATKKTAGRKKKTEQ